MTWIRSSLTRLAGDRGGNFAIEFAMALPVLMLLVMGLVDLGRFSMQKSAMLQAASDGAQYGSFNPNDMPGAISAAQTISGVAGVTATANLICECTYNTPVLCNSTCTGNTPPKKYVQVTASKAFSSVMSKPGVGGFAVWTLPSTTSATVTMICP
jgi:Flp pilus assembly protein TadG